MRESAVSLASVARDDVRARMRDDVRAGLLRAGQKELPPTYFYDARGSLLFDEITRTNEYYPTRSERALLEAHAASLIADTGARALAELGAGTASKSRILIRALVADGPAQYLPLDVDAETLADTARGLRAEFPTLDVVPIAADMREHVAATGARHPLLYAFLGSTIGNFDPCGARGLLANIRASLRPTDRLLLGLDLIKDTATIDAAYNDAGGITAQFNLNVLAVLNRELGADFNLGAFAHRAFYDEAHARIEMHLVAASAMQVTIPHVGTVAFHAGETIRTEISCKYDHASASALLADAGFRMTQWLVDEPALFALAVAEPLA